jgi:uncharacterized protein with NRDE domain
MCTLIAAVSMFAATPLVIAANRDEKLDRASSGPRIWPGPPRFIAPRDEVAGGSWLGVNANGLFVGVTNRAAHPRDPSRRSRGALVIDALGATSAKALREKMSAVEAHAYNGFHLLYADRASAHLSWSDGERLSHAELEPGLHLVTERSFSGSTFARETFIRERFSRDVIANGPSVETLSPILAHHDDVDPFASVCVHAEAFNYGTRSSTIFFLREDLPESELFFTDARPCATSFHRVAELDLVLAESALQ